MAFYEFNQNNSGGRFTVNDKLCHRLYIEADSQRVAIVIAEDLGVYFDCCEKGIDCDCCGDRWSEPWSEVDLDKMNENGYTVSVHYWNGGEEEKWFDKYGSYGRMSEPKWVNHSFFRAFEAEITFENIEEYAQFLADEYGWTSPDARIFYKDGTVKEIFSKEVESKNE